MSERVTMPALGESVTEGTVTRWLKSVGDQVAVDEPLLEVSTDKVDTEIPSPVAGTLTEILVQEDETVAVGADLAVIGDGSDAPAAEAPAEQAPAEQAPEAPSTEAPVDSEAPAQAEAPAEQAPEAPSTEAPVDSEVPAPAAGSGGGSVEGGTTVTMPALGESVTEGTVTRWLKTEGDEVAVDEPLLEVSTDKVDTEIPSPAAGTLTKILVPEDETVAVGADLAIIGGTAVAEAPAAAPEAAPAAAAKPEPAKAPEP
ncbi:MAG TPA: 2-oxoglutarate dehydrogenase, E2 component, dihydrolipoamide succinyltransferase, partial [Tetrasphaera sp.]|uniref:biotin/lipoyl-containing protein n=1 Tax=Nostocoides sp. TaxID=1917966 RepID=UPI002C5EDBF9